MSLFKPKPLTFYNAYVSGQATPVASFKTNTTGAANGTTIGPLRQVISTLSGQAPTPARVVVMEGDTPVDPSNAVLVSIL